MTPALAEAARAGGTTFGLLEVGERFVFFKSDAAHLPDRIFVKETTRAYRYLLGKKRWKISAGTTVYRETP